MNRSDLVKQVEKMAIGYCDMEPVTTYIQMENEMKRYRDIRKLMNSLQRLF